MDVVSWIERHLAPVACDSTRLLYDDMETQSGGSLALVDRPFDASRRRDWCDRGQVLGFLLAIDGEGGRLLDFGPGDGWPSLPLAPFAAQVVGVDGSARRVDVCRRNAARLGVGNASFVHVAPHAGLPFPDATFDGATAASSLEQTPDPRAALAEIRRVLRPGARLSIRSEDLDRYRGGREREFQVEPLSADRCRVTIHDRRIDDERATMIRLDVSMGCDEARRLLGGDGVAPSADRWTEATLTRLAARVADARRCALSHPSAATWVRLLRETGFRDARATGDGGVVAGGVFDRTPPPDRPADLAGVDRLLRGPVAEAVAAEAPAGRASPITAVR